MNFENMQKQPVEQPKKSLPVQIIEDAIKSGKEKDILEAESRIKDLYDAAKKMKAKAQLLQIQKALMELADYRDSLGKEQVKAIEIKDLPTQDELKKILEDIEPDGRA